MPNKLTQEEFLTKVLIKNSNLDFSNSKFENTRTKVKVRCRVCTFEWEILPKPLFTKEVKCPRCSGRDRINSNFSDMPMTLYFIKININLEGTPEYIYKVGITKYNVLRRFNPDDLRRIDILKEIEFQKGEEAYEMEQTIANMLREFKYYGSFRLSSNGNTELYTINPLEYLKGRSEDG